MAVTVVSRMVVATALLIVLAAVPAAVADNYKVGDTSGWTTGVTYTDWTQGKTFKVGDTLEFVYGNTHSVDVVDKAGYDNCDSSKPIKSYTGGDNKITLTTAGTMYFICPTPGHCDGGMKLAVTVQGSTPGSPTTPAGTPAAPSGSPPEGGSPRSGSTTPGSGSTTTPSKPNSASRGLVSYGMIGVSVVLGYLVGFMG